MKYKCTAFLFLLSLFFATSYSQWSWQTSGTTQPLYSIRAANSNTAWIAGHSGIILKTTNGGQSWFSQVNVSPYALYGIYVFDTNKVLMVGLGGEITRTINGGTNWDTIYSGSLAEFQSITFIDSLGWICGSGGVIYKSTDAGENWSLQSTIPTYDYLYSIYFVNSNTGWVVGMNTGASAGVIHKTTNGGVNWVTQTSGSQHRHLSVHFYDENTGWAAGYYGTVFKTTNGGTNWADCYPGTSPNFEEIYFVDANTGWAVGHKLHIIKTTNGGVNWSVQVASASSERFYSTHFVNNNTGWTVGQAGKIITTSNGGVSFISKINNNTPDKYSLYQNYPNPFNPSTNIKFDIRKSSLTKLSVYNILGKEIAVLVNEKLNAGSYEVEWNASGYPSGVYFYKLVTDEFSDVKKMICIK